MLLRKGYNTMVRDAEIRVSEEVRMSTSSTVGVLKRDGTFEGVYVNFDGYASHMIPALEAAVKRYGVQGFLEQVRQGQREAGFRSVHDTGEVETYGDMRGEVSEGDGWCHNTVDALEGHAYLVQEWNGEVGDARVLLAKRTWETLAPVPKPVDLVKWGYVDPPDAEVLDQIREEMVVTLDGKLYKLVEVG